MKKKFALALMLALVTVVGTALAQTRKSTGGPFAPLRQRFAARFQERIQEELRLTDEQKAQIRAIIEAARPTVAPLLREAAVNHQALNAATANGQFNETQIRAIAVRQGRVAANLIVEKERVTTQIYQILTPEQRARAQEMKTQFETRIRELIEAR